MSPSFCARDRAMTSVAPPAAKGTTSLTGFVGHDWANAEEAIMAPMKTKVATRSWGRILIIRVCASEKMACYGCRATRSQAMP
ncbi:protein of unknown function (plasmid) [Cupriavidus taiwanensis]|uniref:Uncharacterized protein n=2 Tax=Cupriavidus TaxID=106589 RepID=A0A375HTY9_9BURK|nr:protein of unknown function [Cupriavidus taiwanensis]SOZ39766.1 hypothetical protein CBM2605_B40097 [Cupriavidus neocaledonicus]SOZ11713.1 protein of unknown function [Cupriavidus taiwanensis]SOZ43068.1 protein of unknown function [Cupriavidus taiwanensis]SPC22314.1 protein of unknown function [Cupriavidus taiwanensis]